MSRDNNDGLPVLPPWLSGSADLTPVGYDFDDEPPEPERRTPEPAPEARRTPEPRPERRGREAQRGAERPPGAEARGTQGSDTSPGPRVSDTPQNLAPHAPGTSPDRAPDAPLDRTTRPSDTVGPAPHTFPDRGPHAPDAPLGDAPHTPNTFPDRGPHAPDAPLGHTTHTPNTAPDRAPHTPDAPLGHTPHTPNTAPDRAPHAPDAALDSASHTAPAADPWLATPAADSDAAPAAPESARSGAEAPPLPPLPPPPPAAEADAPEIAGVEPQPPSWLADAPPQWDSPATGNGQAGAPATAFAPPQQPEPTPAEPSYQQPPQQDYRQASGFQDYRQQGYQQQPAPQNYHQPGPAYAQPQVPPSIDDVPLLRRVSKSPGSGWRRAVHHMSAGAIQPGLSKDEIYVKELVDRIRQPARGDYRIAVLSLKGGVGKTTTTIGLGSTFASLRGDRVIAVDANPDLGTLASRVPQQTRSTVRDLLRAPSVHRYADVRAHTSQAKSRLEVLASERDPAISEAFSEDEYRQVVSILQRFYNIILTDCGTGLMHSAMRGVLDMAHSLVLISSPAIDGARSAAATLDWLGIHGYGHLVSNAVVVISSARPGSPNIGLPQLTQYFLSRCRAVHIIPFDDHLSEGAEIDLDLLDKKTRRAFLQLAATVSDDFQFAGGSYRPR